VNDNTSQGGSPVEQTPTKAVEELVNRINSLEGQIQKQNQGFASMRKSLETVQGERDALKRELSDLGSEGNSAPKKEEQQPHVDGDIQRAIEAALKSQGVVTKSELQERENKVLNDQRVAAREKAIDRFLANHPEYDTDDMWAAVIAEAKLYREPNNIEEYDAMFNRIHSTLSKGAGNARSMDTSSQRKVDVMSQGSSGGGSVQPRGGSGSVSSLTDIYKKASPEHVSYVEAELRKLGFDPSALLNR
jgi:chromosome segregation ATPase